MIGNIDTDIEDNNIVKVAPCIGELSEFGAVIASTVVLHIFANELSCLSFKDPDAPHDVNLRRAIDRLYTGPVAGWNT